MIWRIEGFHIIIYVPNTHTKHDRYNMYKRRIEDGRGVEIDTMRV